MDFVGWTPPTFPFRLPRTVAVPIYELATLVPGERDGVLCRDALTVAEGRDRERHRRLRIEIVGLPEPLGDLARGDVRPDEIEEASAAGRV
jgi:hypothetical protein